MPRSIPTSSLDCVLLVGDEWTQSSGHLTGTMKIRRDAIEHSNGANLDRWLEQKQTVVWHGV